MTIEVEIVPSILAADFANLERALTVVAEAGARAVQVDVMDGHFVPNLTIGAPVVAALRRVSSLILDVHLMIEKPGDMVEAYAKAGADQLTVHVEACTHLHRVVQQIRSAGMRPGVALNPATPLVAIEEILPDVDIVLLMTVNPGFGGQAFIPHVLPKLRRLRRMLDERGLNETLIEVDGGITLESAPQAVAAGARWLVAGSSVYGGGVAGVGERFRALRAAAEAGLTAS